MWKSLLLIWFIGIYSVVSCPHHCQCYLDEGLRTANCSGSALTTYQQQPSEVDVLNIRPHYSGFRTRLSPRGFKNFQNIKSLNLRNTSITIIPDEVFYGLNYIITIDLSYNKIKHLNGGVFKQLSTLRTLVLRGNPLMFVQSDFIVSTSLRKLDLGSCGLHYIPPGMFTYVTNLALLFLDSNSIQTIDRYTVPAGISYINLANNNIANVPTDILHKLKSLTRIDLSGNPIRCTCQLLLLQDTFSGQGRIFENDITCLGPRQFYGQKLSLINENDLCNLEFIKKERYINSIKHFRDRDVRSSYRKHNMIKPLPTDDSFGIQGDQPQQLSDELIPNHDSEVMFSNDDTRSMGTHMALNSFTVHNPQSSPIDISDENNKLSVNKENLPATDSDLSSTEVEVVSSEEEEEDGPGELMELPDDDNADDLINIVDTDHNITGKHSFTDPVSAEIFSETSSQLDQQYSSTENIKLSTVDEEVKLMGTSKLLETPEEEITDGVSTLFSVNHTDSAEKLSTIHQELEDLNENITQFSKIHDIEEISTQHEGNSDGTFTSSPLEDVEEFNSSSYNFTHESASSFARLVEDHNVTKTFDDTSISSIDDIFKNDLPPTTMSPNIETYTWPTSQSDIIDYSYDTQHDYSSLEPLASVTDSLLPLTTALYTEHEDKSTTESPPSSSISLEMEEGSGLNGTEEELHLNEGDEESTSFAWLEEQENETTTEKYLVESVAEIFNTSSEEVEKFSPYTVESNISSSEMTTTGELEVTTIVSPETSEGESEELLTTTEESTTEEEVLTIFESTSEKTSSEGTLIIEDTTASTLEEEEKDETTTAESITEEGTVSSEPSTTTSEISSSSFSYIIPFEVTSEEIGTTEKIESSTDSIFIPNLTSQEEKDEVSSTSVPPIISESTPTEILSSSEKVLDILIPSTSESISSTPVSEVEVVSKTVYIDDKENMILDPTKEEISKDDEEKDDGPDLATIGIMAAIILLILIILLISMAVICRRTKRPRNKIRLPIDPEANLGTEMQDMLLPKPPENGVKVVPKNYTNGTTASNTNGSNKPEQQLEEEIPVLGAEPEVPLQEEPSQDWEDKPEPIETVTAKLTMLARPQTPVFIANTLN